MIKNIVKESIRHPLLSISPLETKGKDGQAWLETVLNESKRHPIRKGWTSRVKGSVKRGPFDIVYCPLSPYGQMEGMDKHD